MPKSYPGDLEYDLATNFGQAIDASLVARIRVPEYRQVVKVFVDSIHRIRRFHWLPIELIFLIRLTSTAHAIAAQKLGLDPADLFKRVASDEEDALGHQIFEKMTEGAISAYGLLENAVWKQGNLALKALLSGEIVGTERKSRVFQIEAVLAAIITASYAALETLAEDLWIAAADRHPNLSQNWAERNEKKNVPWSEIAGRNLTKGMGSLLSRKRSVQFVSFYDVKNVYLDSFRDVMQPVFANTADVLHAEKVRHLIAHRAGVIDVKFRDEMKNHPEYANLSVGDQILLDGPTVAKHFEACLRMGESIIMAVDNWSVLAPTE